MKKFAIASLLAICAMGAIAQTANKEQVFLAIASLQPLNGNEVTEMRKFVESATDAQLKSVLLDMTYSKAVLIDNPGELDKEDLKNSLARYDLAKLAAYAQSSNLK